MPRIDFSLPLYPGRYVFSDQALDDLAEHLSAGTVPMTLGADGPKIGTVRSAVRDGDAVTCVAEVEGQYADMIAGVGLDVAIPHRDKVDGLIPVPSIAETRATIARTVDTLQDGARPLGE